MEKKTSFIGNLQFLGKFVQGSFVLVANLGGPPLFEAKTTHKKLVAKGFPFHWDRLREPFGWVFFCLMIMNHFV